MQKYLKWLFELALPSSLTISIILLVSPVRAETILVMGDSHTCSTPFGPQLAKNLESNGRNSVVVYCSGGTSVQYWLRPQGFHARYPNRCMTYNAKSLVQTPLNKPLANLNLNGEVKGSSACVEGTTDLPPLKKILSKVHPDRVVVALGTNNIGMNALGSFSEFADQIKDSGASCAWVGPPALGTNSKLCAQNRKNLPALIQSIKASVKSSCSYVDSQKWTQNTSTPDCPHRHGKEAITWANGVYGAMEPSGETRLQPAPTQQSAP